jgi:hypothetical protein
MAHLLVTTHEDEIQCESRNIILQADVPETKRILLYVNRNNVIMSI